MGKNYSNLEVIEEITNKGIGILKYITLETNIYQSKHHITIKGK